MTDFLPTSSKYAARGRSIEEYKVDSEAKAICMHIYMHIYPMCTSISRFKYVNSSTSFKP